jgi:hypothetical protein
MALLTFDVLSLHIPQFKALLRTLRRQGVGVTLRGSTVRTTDSTLEKDHTRLFLTVNYQTARYIAGYLQALADINYRP